MPVRATVRAAKETSDYDLKTLIVGGGELGERIREFDWTVCSLGPIPEWPMTLRTIVNMMLQSPVPLVLLWGPDGIMLYNDAYSVFAGARHPSLLGSKILEGWPEVADFNRNVMDKGFSGQTLSYKDQQLTLYRNNIAEQVWMDLNYSPIIDESGKPAGVLAIVVETTQRVLAEQGLKESEARFRTMAEDTEVLISVANDQFQSTYFNKAWSVLTGRSMEELIDLGWTSLVHPDDLDSFLNTYRKALANKQSFNGEFRILNSQGEYRWLLAHVPARFRPDGSFAGFISSYVDITERKQVELALKKSEALFRQIFETNTLGIFFWDMDGNVLDANDYYLNLVGYSRDELARGKVRWRDLTPPEQWAWDDAGVVEMLANGKATTPYEKQYIHKDGHRVDILIGYSLVPGQPGKGVGFIIDITERKQAEAELKESEDKFRTFANNIQNLAWMAEPDGWIFWYNQRWYDYTGTTFEEMQGWGWEKVHRPELIDELVAFLKEAWQKGETWERTFPLRGVDGQYRWFLTRAYAVKDDEGNVVRWIGTNTDIDAQKKAEEALQYQNYLTQSITDNATAGLFMMNERGICTFMNSAAEEISGYSWEELRQQPDKPLHDWVHFKYPDGSPYPISECPIDRALPENNDLRAHEDVFVRRDGTLYNVSCAARPIIKDGIPVGTLVEVRDITEKKRAEEDLKNYARLLESSNRELEQFATIASHDLQEPLRKVKVFGEMLKPLIPQAGQDYLRRMIVATERMQSLITDLLAMSRINRKEKDFGPVDLNKVVRGVIDDLQIAVTEADAVLSTEPLGEVFGDEGQIRQLIQNIIGNALKYRREWVQAQVKIYGQPIGSFYQVSIEDNGIGIAKEYYERIFEPFQRLHGLGKYRGTGVGLTICKKIVERHQGIMTVESEPNQGSRFSFTLPISR
jgi:PAS domain S-box-containing protein